MYIVKPASPDKIGPAACVCDSTCEVCMSQSITVYLTPAPSYGVQATQEYFLSPAAP